MDRKLQLEDLVYSYPDIGDPNFQTKISSKQEFIESGSLEVEAPPKRGKLFLHQQFTLRYILQYNRLFLIHDTGTGKSCNAIAPAELFKREFMNGISSFIMNYIRPVRSNIKRVYVLVRGDTLKAEFKNQIVCKCSQPGAYETPKILEAVTPTDRKRNITIELKKYYEIITYASFVNTINQKQWDDEQLKKKFSDCLFVVDEVHNLRIDPKKKIKGTKKTEKIRIYDTLHRVFHLIERSKIMLLSATPMVNEAYEIGPLMNLILPMSKQIPGITDFVTATATELFPYFNGYVSFVRQANTSADPMYVGQKIPRLSYNVVVEPQQRIQINPLIPPTNTRIVQTQAIIYPTIMSGYAPGTKGFRGQQYYYNIAAERTGDTNILAEGARLFIPAVQKQRQAGNFVFPDGSYGGTPVVTQTITNPRTRKTEKIKVKKFPLEGFDKYVKQVTRTVTRTTTNKNTGLKRQEEYQQPVYPYWTPSPELLQWISKPKYLRALSSKYSEIIRLCKQGPDGELDLFKKKMGTCFCYSDFVEGSGSILLSLCFRANGFEMFDESSDVFSRPTVHGVTNIGTTLGGRKLLSVCPSTSALDKNRDSRITKKLRYALLTSETSAIKERVILETFNSPENHNGEYIKVLITSPVGREGINTANVTQIFLVGPSWNHATSYQAISRAIRATSHVYLLDKLKQRLRDEGKDPETAGISVKIYNMVALTTNNSLSNGVPIMSGPRQSVDVQLVKLSERKDIQIRRIMRIMKRSAVDCHIHRKRNIRPGDVDYSPVCDYDLCSYVCMTPAPTTIDRTSYDVLYTGSIIDEIEERLKGLFGLLFSINYYKLYKHMKQLDENYEPRFINQAVTNIINERSVIVNRFGYESYLLEHDSHLFLSVNYPISVSSGQLPISYYTENLIMIRSEGIQTYINSLTKTMQSQFIENLKRLSPDNPEYERILSDLSNTSIANLLEQAIEIKLKATYGIIPGGTNQVITLAETQRLQGYTPGWVDDIIARNSRNVFGFYEPVELIDNVLRDLSTRGTKRGRKPKIENVLNTMQIIIPQNFPSFTLEEITTRKIPLQNIRKRNLVIVHRLYSKKTGHASFGVTGDLKRGEKLRKLDISQFKWGDVGAIENPVYVEIIQKKIQELKTRFRQFDIYGTILEDMKFRVIFVGLGETKGPDTGKAAKTGQNCATISKFNLINILLRIGVPAPLEIDEVDRNTMLERIMKEKASSDILELVPGWNIDQLRYFYKWIVNGNTKPSLCPIVQRKLEAMGRIFRG